jgi:hypothetical protein
MYPATAPSPGQMDPSTDEPVAATTLGAPAGTADEPQGASLMAERLRAEHETLSIAMHEGPVQNLTMLGIRLKQARARLARGEIEEAERALRQLQLTLAHEISALRRMLTAERRAAS